MNILFCGSFKVKNLGTHFVHIYELLSNLSKLGHCIVPIKTDTPANGKEIDTKEQLLLWEHIKNSLRSSPIYKPLKGEIAIFLSLLSEIRMFFLVFALIVKQKGRFDVIYRRHSLFNSEYLLGKVFRIPSVKEVNGIVADEAKTKELGDNVSLGIINFIERFNMPKADRIIVVTSRLKEVLHNDYNIPQERIVVIPNGANIELFKPVDSVEARDELNLNQGVNYICFVGSLSPWQGVKYLIKSLPLVLEGLPNTKFLVIGDGSMKKELVELAEQSMVSANVMFTGMAPYDRVPLYINASDVCIAPFIRARNQRCGLSPLKVYEYMACAKPIVASRIANLELIEQTNAGILVEPESVQELGNAIIRLLKDEGLRKQMGENGRRYVVKNNSWESVARKVAIVCQQTLEEYRSKKKPSKL